MEQTTQLPEGQMARLELKDISETSADELAELFGGSRLELVVEGALSEWGSLLEEFSQKLERGVNKWHEPGTTKSVIITFVEGETVVEDEPPA